MFSYIKSPKIKVVKIGFIGKFLNENKLKANGILNFIRYFKNWL